MHAPTLAELIRADDPNAIAGFRDSHVRKVRAYCEQACPEELREESVDAAFIDFLGRVGGSTSTNMSLEELMLMATRAAAAGRVEVKVPPTVKKRASPEAICLAMPELVAATSNRELGGDQQRINHHAERCLTCAATIERLKRAERAFVRQGGWGAHDRSATPGAEIQDANQASEASEHEPTTRRAIPAPAAVRVRRGGLGGAARRLFGSSDDRDRLPRP